MATYASTPVDESSRPRNDSKVDGYAWCSPQSGINALGRAVIPSSDFAYALPLRLINGMPTDQYVNAVKGQILDARDYRMFDTRWVAAAAALPVNKFDFFNVPVNKPEVSLDGSQTVLNKTQNYTNMLEDGKVEGGNTMIVDSIQVAVYTPHRDFNAFGTAPVSAFPTTGAPSATDTLSGTLNLLALNYNTYLTFSEPNRGNFAEGHIFAFPSVEIASGFFGGQTTEGLIQIGVGQPQYLRYVRVLQELHHFDVDLTCYQATTFPIQMIIQIALCGIKLVS